ncbi:tail fiber domain-containing protein [Flavobacteriaceae bacterium]|nr:tail fiber domain-containing protein [Flavobacteriaceae bacterium]
MAGYTRQSTFADGDTITSALFNNEYNQLLNAFGNTSGHKHDGTANEGPVIGLIGDAGVVTPLNKVLIDSTNDHIEFWIEVSSSAVQQLYIADGAIVPVTDNDIDLGTSSLQFKDLYINGTANIDSLVLATGSTVTAVLDEDDLSSDSATSLVTQQSVKAYIDAQVTAQDLDFLGDSGGALSIDLDSESLTIAGGAGIDTSGATNTLTVAIDSTVATLTGSQTLTNKTINVDNNTVSNIEVDNFKASAIVLESEGIGSNDNDTSLPTSAAVKDYVDTQITAEDLDITTDSGTIAIDLDSETLTVSGGTGLDSSATGNAVTLAIDSTVTTLTGTQTLTNKTLTSATLTSPDVNTPDIDGGTIDGATIATSDVTVGAGKTLDVSAGTLTLADNQISGDKVEGGTIAATTITDLTFGSLNDGTITATAFVDEDNMASNSATLIPTQQSVKAYVDTTVAATNEVVEDTTPQLGGDLDLNSSDITGTGNINITGTLTSDGLTVDGTATATSFNGFLESGVTATPTNSSAATIYTASGSHPDYASTDLIIQARSSAARSIYMLTGTTTPVNRFKVDGSGDISFYEDTGTTAALFWDASAERLGIGTTSPSANLHVLSSGDTIARITSADGNGAFLDLGDASDPDGGRIVYDSGSNLGFSTASTERMRIDSSGNVGIGTDSPATTLTVEGSGANGIELNRNGADASQSARLFFDSSTSGYALINVAGSLTFNSGSTAGSSSGTERMRIDSSGNVGIGTGISGAVAPILRLGNAGTSGGVVTGTLSLGSYSTAFGSNIISSSNFSSNSSSYLAFGTTPSGAVGGSQPTERMRIDSSGRVGIGETSPQNPLHVRSDSASGENYAIQIDNNNTTVGSQIGMLFRSRVGGTNTDFSIRGIANGTDDMDLAFNSDGGSERMRIDSSGNVGIGTSSPAESLHTTGNIRFGDSAPAELYTNSSELRLGVDKNNDNGTSNITFFTDNAEKVRIDSSGDVGIGTDSPDGNLHVSSGSAGTVTASTDANELVLEAAANVGMTLLTGNSSIARIRFGDADSNARGNIFYNHSNDSLGIQTAASTAMTIDSSGNLLVGKTTTAFSTEGFVYEAGAAVEVTTDSNRVMRLNRTTSDGNIIELNKDGSTVGSIGTMNFGDMYLGTDDTGIYFNNGIDSISPINTTNQTVRDNAIDLGASNARFKDLYLSSKTKYQAAGGNQHSIGVDANDLIIRSETAGSDTARFTYGGDLLVGTTATNPAGANSVGVGISSGSYGGFIGVTRDGNTPVEINRKTSDGTLITFRKDSSTVGSIGTVNGDLLVGTGDTGLRFHDTDNRIYPINTSGGTKVDATIDLGDPTGRFKDLYLSQALYCGKNTAAAFNTTVGVAIDGSNGYISTARSGGPAGYFNRITSDGDIVTFLRDGSAVGSVSVTTSATAYNTSSDARLKDVTGSARGLEVINELNPVSYNWKADGKADEGLIAQEVKELVPNAVTGSEEEMYQMDYSKLVVHLVAGMKEQQTQIEALQSEINKLKTGE